MNCCHETVDKSVPRPAQALAPRAGGWIRGVRNPDVDALKENEKMQQSTQGFHYSNFQSLIIGKDELAKELQAVKQTPDQLEV